MRIQETLGNSCQGIKQFASKAVNWIGHTVSTIGSKLKEIALKIAEFVKPHFENFKNYVKDHKGPVFVAVIAGIGGLIVGILAKAFCCKDKQPVKAGGASA